MNKYVRRMFGGHDLTSVVGEGQDAMRDMCTKLGAYVYDLMESNDVTPWELDAFLSNPKNWDLMKLWERTEDDEEYRRDEMRYDRMREREDDVDEQTIAEMQDDNDGIPPMDYEVRDNQAIAKLSPEQLHDAFVGAQKRHMANTEISEQDLSDIDVDEDLTHEVVTHEQQANEDQLVSHAEASLESKDNQDDATMLDLNQLMATVDDDVSGEEQPLVDVEPNESFDLSDKAKDSLDIDIDHDTNKSFSDSKLDTKKDKEGNK